MNKRFLALLLALLLVLPAAAACSNNGGKEFTDEYGETYTLDGDGNKVYKIIAYDYNTAWAENPKYRQRVLDEINSYALEELGYKVEFDYRVFGDNYGTRLNADLNSRQRVDVTRNHWRSEILGRIEGKTAKDITSYLAMTKNMKNDFTEEDLRPYISNGKLYAIPDRSYLSETCLWVRTDLLVSAGYVNENGSAKIPANLEEFENMLKAIKDGNVLEASNNSAPLALDFQDLEQFFLGCFTDTPAAYLNGSGNLEPKFYSDDYKAFVAKMRDWVKKGYLIRTFDGRSSNVSIGDAFKRGRVAVMGYNIYASEYGVINDWKNQGYDKLAPIPLFFDDAGTERKIYSKGSSNQYMWFPYTSKTTRATLLFYDWVLYDQDIYDLCTLGIKDLTYIVSEENNVLIPPSEKDQTALVLTPRDLIGEFVLLKDAKKTLKWVYPEMSVQYNDLQQLYAFADKNKFYYDPLTNINTYIDDAVLRAAYNEAEMLVLAEMQKLIDKTSAGYYSSDSTFDAKYEAIKGLYKTKRGEEAYAIFNQRYTDSVIE